MEKLSKIELVKHKEDDEEFGGYFIMNGNEYLIRKLIAQRRNYVSDYYYNTRNMSLFTELYSQPMALIRKSWVDSGLFFSEYGISIRCVRNDQIGSVCDVMINIFFLTFNI